MADNNADGSAAATADAEAKKVGDIIETPASDDKKQGETVPLAAFLELKKENKETKKQVENLEALIKNGASEKELTAEINALAEETGMKPEQIQKMVSIAAKLNPPKSSSKDEDAAAELQKAEDLKNKSAAEKAQAIEAANKAFDTEYARVLELMPEFSEIADLETIRAVALRRDASGKLVNADKKMGDLIEATYSKALPAKRTIPDTRAGGGKEPEALDDALYAKAKKDGPTFEKIMANPELKKAYNERMMKESMRR